jgi:hypothetical protein
MPWQNDPEARRRSAEVYSDPEYLANRKAARKRAGGRCEQCGHRHGRLQCDHGVPVSQGGGHALTNLKMLCAGPGSCHCHEQKTAQEGGGYRARKTGDPEPKPRTQW